MKLDAKRQTERKVSSKISISPRYPYLFSAGEDKQVKYWDLEVNKVVRHYHCNLSGVYSIALHPTLDVLVTGGRDSAARA
jgi:pleiotropic regulator 1